MLTDASKGVLICKRQKKVRKFLAGREHRYKEPREKIMQTMSEPSTVQIGLALRASIQAAPEGARALMNEDLDRVCEIGSGYQVGADDLSQALRQQQRLLATTMRQFGLENTAARLLSRLDGASPVQRERSN